MPQQSIASELPVPAIKSDFVSHGFTEHYYKDVYLESLFLEANGEHRWFNSLASLFLSNKPPALLTIDPATSDNTSCHSAMSSNSEFNLWLCLAVLLTLIGAMVGIYYWALNILPGQFEEPQQGPTSANETQLLIPKNKNTMQRRVVSTGTSIRNLFNKARAPNPSVDLSLANESMHEDSHVYSDVDSDSSDGEIADLSEQSFNISSPRSGHVAQMYLHSPQKIRRPNFR